MYAATIATVAGVVVAVDWSKLGRALFRWEIVKEQFPDILTTALRNTVLFTVYGFLGGLSLGLVLAVMRLSKVKPYRWFAAVYIEVLRGVPLLVTLLILGFGIPIATGWRWPNPYVQGAVPLATLRGLVDAHIERELALEATPATGG